MHTSSGFIIVQPGGWAQPRGYANALRVPAGRDLVFVAGQIGWDEQCRIVGPSFVEQFQRALQNCVTLVESAGGTCADIVRMTVFCTNRMNYLGSLEAVGAAYRSVMGRHFPAMSLVEVSNLVEAGALVEIEATAAVKPAVRGEG